MATINPGPMLVTSRERPREWTRLADAAPLWLCAFLVLLGTPALASGWTDYRVKLGAGYEIVKANTVDIHLCRDSRGVLWPIDESKIGPIHQYEVTPTHIYTRHYGRKLRNRFPGDIFPEVDFTKDYYFITAKTTAAFSGPFTKAEFDARPELGGTTANWRKVSNPNILRPLLGAALVVVSLAVFFWPITVGAVVLTVVGYLVFRGLTARRRGMS